MATILIKDNILEQKEARSIFAKEGEFKTIRDAVERLAGNEAYAGKLVECYDPETDATTWEPMDGGMELSVAVYANGEEADIEYEIKDADDIFIIVLPSGGREGWGFFGALLGVMVGVAFTVFTAGGGFGALAGAGFKSLMEYGLAKMTFGQLIMGALAGGVAGYALATTIYDVVNGRNGSGSLDHLEGKNYPGVKGSKNQSLLGKNYPFILGRHLFTPPYINAPYSRSEGKLGEDQTISIVFAAGYAPMRLTEFRLGEMVLAYNKTTTHAWNKTIMHGKFKAPSNNDPQYRTTWNVADQTYIDGLLSLGTLTKEKERIEYQEPYNGGAGSYGYGGYSWAPVKYRDREYYKSHSSTILVEGGSECPEQIVKYKVQSQVQDETDSGEILHRWINNDIHLEILQQNPDAPVDWGELPQRAVMQDEVNATPLYIRDGDLGGVAVEAGITYKGCVFDNGFRNNTVRFSRANPMKIEIELEASSGIFETYQKNEDNSSETKYNGIPCWYAIQWRPYNSKSADSYVELDPNPSDPSNPWYTFDYINKYTENGTDHYALVPETYTSTERGKDVSAHKGNKDISDASAGWEGRQLFNLGALIDRTYPNDNSEDKAKKRISMQRFTAVADLTGNGRGAEFLRNKILNKEQGWSNTNHTVEVRVVRISACYLNQTKSDINSKESARQYTDVVKWNSLTTYTFDADKLEQGTLEPQKVTKESEMRKLCVIGLRAKADTGGNIQGQLGKFNFVAESFSPTFGKEDGKTVIRPAGIEKKVAYYKPYHYDPETKQYDYIDTEHEITKEEYEQLRQEGWPAEKRNLGNGYSDALLREIFSSTPETLPDGTKRYFLEDAVKEKYVDNNAASSSMLALIGKQNGIDALGYEDLNLDSFSEFYEFCKSVSDNSKYKVDETVFTDDLSSVTYQKGETITMKFACNACVSNAIKVETLLQKCLATGRALYTRDENNKIKVVIDRAKNYPVMLINQQNTISGTNSISYDVLPAGLQLSFSDESDGFTNHSILAMANGEDSENPTKEIESYSIDYVTNRHQLHSLGMYALATRSMSRETLTRKIGPEGFCAEIGDLVKVSDDTILIGTDLGGRVKELIEDSQSIYGFVIDETWKYTGKTEQVFDANGDPLLDENDEPIYRCVQGAELLQPTKYKQARVVSYRAALPGTEVNLWRVVVDGNIYTTSGTITIDGVEYTWIDNTQEQKYFDGHYYERYFDVEGEIIPVYQVKYKMVPGDTNLMLFDKPVAKNGSYSLTEDSQITYHKPEIDDIVAFGLVGQVSALYLVTKIKPDKDYNFDLTLTQYNEMIYMAGDWIPDIQPQMTIPDRSGEDSFPLDMNLTPADAQRLVSSNVALAIQALSDGTAEVTEPDAAEVEYCKAGKTGISLKLKDMAKGAKNSILTVYWQVAKTEGQQEPQDGDWANIVESGTQDAFYEFDRSTDGYPEKGDLCGSGTHTGLTRTSWWFRAKVKNIYGKEGEWSDAELVNCDTYGTWIVGQPQIQVSVSKRMATLQILQPQTSVEQYSTVRNKVGIKKSSIQEDYWKPDLAADPYASEDNYKTNIEFDPTTEGAYEEADLLYRQLLPLKGQNDTIFRYDCYKTFDDELIQDQLVKTWYNESEAIIDSLPMLIDGTLVTRENPPQWDSENQYWWFVDSDNIKHIIRNREENAPNPVWTTYNFKIVPYSVETGLDGGFATQTVDVGASSAEDIVNQAISTNKLAPDSVVTEKIAAGAITADKISVKELSAITANMGAITNGAFQGNNGDFNNLWALGKGLYNGVFWQEGTFHVGDGNNYIKIDAVDQNGEVIHDEMTPVDRYLLRFKANEFEVESEITSFRNEFAIYSGDYKSRFYMTAKGFSLQTLSYAESKEDWLNNPDIITVSNFYADEKGNFVLTNAETPPGFITVVPENMTVYPLNETKLDGTKLGDLDSTDSLSLNLPESGLDDMVQPDIHNPFLIRGDGTAEFKCYKGNITLPTEKNFCVWNKGCFLSVGDHDIQLEPNLPSSEVATAFNQNKSADWGLTNMQLAILNMETV